MTDALHVPLLFSRDGLDPIAELGERRATEPVSKLESKRDPVVKLVPAHDRCEEQKGNH